MSVYEKDLGSVDKYKELITELCNTKSVSGEEDAVQRIVYDFFSKRGFPKKDALGNVFFKSAANTDSNIMVSAHVDEIGLIVNYIDNDGFIYFTNIGFVEPINLVGQRVWVNDAPGVIAKNPSYFVNKTEGSKELTIDELWIDIGAHNKEEAEKSVSVGDTIALANEVLFLPDNRIISKSLDNKAGVIAMLAAFEETSKRHLDINYSFVSTVQEEIGFRGAKTIASLLKPDAAIVIDVTNATDTPGANKRKFCDVKVDGGPVIGIGANINKEMAQLLIDLAKQNNLPYQTKAFATTSNTEANIIEIVDEGVKTCVVAIPCRYMHSSYELVSLNDVFATAKLIELLFVSLNQMKEQ